MAKKTEKNEKLIESNGISFSEKILKVLANFASINPSLIIYGDHVDVMSTSKSVVGGYVFDEPMDFEKIPLYECSGFLQAYNAIDKASFEVTDDAVVIKGVNDKLTYYMSDASIIDVVPNVSEKFAKVTCDLKFVITADKLAILQKMAAIIKADFIFFESAKEGVRITVADKLETSANSYDIFVTNDVKVSKLTEPVKIELSNFKILPGDYEIELSPAISKWSGTSGVEYFIGASV